MSGPTLASPSDRQAAPALGGLAVLVLVGLYVYSDRLLISLQGQDIRQALALSDLQFGLIQGASVALFSAVVGYPVGWMADRFDPRRVLAACLLVWGAAIAACGLAASFEALFAASALLGAAEAGLLPIAYALIPIWFQGRNRQRANAAFVFCGRLMVGLVILVCAWMIREIDTWRSVLPDPLAGLDTWRLSLLATALPCLLLVPVVLRLPDAGRSPAGSRPPPMPQALAWMGRRAGWVVPLFAGPGVMALSASAVGNFVPMLAQRTWNVSPQVAGQAMGMAALVGAAGALMLVLLASRRVNPSSGPRLPLLGAAAGLGLATAVTPLIAVAPSLAALFAVYGLHLFGVLTASMLFPTALAALSPASMRARLLSVYVGVIVILGAAGPALVGWLSDAGAGTADALRQATVGVGSVALLVATGLVLMAARASPADEDTPL